MIKKRKIAYNDFINMFDGINKSFSSYIKDKLNNLYTEYHYAKKDELEEYILSVLKSMQAEGIRRSREKNYNVWKRGWTEQYSEIQSDRISLKDLKPKYYKPNKFLRYNNKLIISDNLNLEYDLSIIARYIIFTKYLTPYNTIYEFGCGSCQNLLLLLKIFPQKKLFGLDWISFSTKIIKLINKKLNTNIKGAMFDMMKPDDNFYLERGSAVFTVHALEQLGSNYEKMLSYFIKAKPAIVVHYEPILEFFNQDNLLDFLSFLYCKKRNYLSGYWPALCKLRKQNKIEIIYAKRPFLGGITNESVIIWKPIN